MKLADASLSPLYQTRTVQLQDEAKVQDILEKSGATRTAVARNDKPAEGQIVGVRLNINLIKKIAVQTIHAGNSSDGYTRNKGLYNGTVRNYNQVAVLRGAFFNVSQSARQKIASGKDSKHPMASIDGAWIKTDTPSFDGIEVSFNPHRVHLFVDALNRPIRYAEEVTIYAHRAYVRGFVEYYTNDNAPEKAGDAPSEVIFTLPDTTDEDIAPAPLPLAAEQPTQASLFI